MKFHITLRARLVLLVMAAIVPLLVLSVARAIWQTDAALKRTTQELALSASLVAANHEQVSEAARQLLESLAVAVLVAQSGTGPDCHTYFKSLKERLPQYVNLGVIGMDGYTRCDGISRNKPVYTGDRAYFQQAVATRSFSSGGYTMGRISGKAALQFALPVIAADNVMSAVVFASLDLQSLSRQVASIAVPEGGRVLVTDRDGLVLAINPARPEMIGSLVENRMLQDRVKSKGRGVEVSPDRNGASRIYAFQPTGDSPASPFFVAVSADRDMAVGPAQRELMVELGVLAAVALVGGLLAWMVGGRGIVRPANSILAATRRIQRGERDVRIPVQRHQAGNEFSRIADGFNLMADSLEQREDDLNTELVRSRHAYDTLQLTINSMKEGLMAVDTVGRVLLFNQTASTVFLMDGAPLVLSGDWPRHHGLYTPGTDHLYSTENLPLVKALGGKSGSTQHIWVRNALHPQGRLISASFHPMMGDHGPNGEASVIGALMVFSDITRLQQMQMEQAKSFIELRETQRRLMEAQRLGRMGNWELDVATQKLWWSDEIYELFGLDRSTFDGRHETLVSLIHPDDRAQYEEKRRQAWRAGTEFETEYRIITPTGEVRWMHQLGRPRAAGADDVSIRSGMVQDITARKKPELALAESYARLSETQRKLLDAQRLGRIGNWEFNPQTHDLWVSDEVYDLFGITKGHVEVKAESMFHIVHPDDLERYFLEIEQAQRTSQELDVEYRIITPAGEVRWMHQIGRSYASDEGDKTYRAGVVQDISVRKRAEQALTDSVDLLKRTGEMARIGGWELFLSDERLVYSEQVYRIHGIEPGTPLRGADAVSDYPEAVRPQLMDALRAAREEGTPWDLELPMDTRTGQRLWVRTQGRGVMVDGKVVRLVGALQDITAQYQSRERLQLLQTCMNRLQDVVMVTEAEPSAELGERGVVYVNDAFERFTGFTPEEMLGKSPMLMDGPLTDRAALRGVAEALKNKRSHRTELKSYNKQREAVLIELDIVPISSAAQQLTHWVWVARDLTSRKQAEQALVDSEQRYMALFESTPLPLWVFDETTLQFLTVNAAAIDQYGFSREEFLSMTVLDIRHARERAWSEEHFSKPFTGESLVVLHCKKNGQEFPVQVVARPIQYEGRAGRFVVALDISARVKAEKDVQDQLFTLQRAADAAQAITSHQTLKAAMQEVADQACGVIGAHQALVMLTEQGEWGPSIYGLSLSEKYAKYRTLSDPVDGSGIYAMVCETKRPMRLTQAELEAHPRWKGFGTYADKHPAMRGWLAVPLMGRDGQSIGVLQLSDKFEGEFTLQDEYVVIELAQRAATALENARLFDEIHRLNLGLEQKVAERTEALSRQEALFRALAEEAPQAIWTINPQSEMTYFNGAFLELVGGEKSQWFGKGWLNLIHPEDLPVLLETWEMALQGQTRYANIRRIRDHSGRWHIMSCTASPVFNESGEVEFWVGIDADITDIKAIEAALRLSNQELEAFSYSVSHDLRSPLNTIDGFSRLLAKQVSAEANEKSRHYLSRIQAGVAQMGQLIEDLLSLAQVSRMQLRVEGVDISVLAQKAVDEWRVRAPEREVHVSIEPGLQAQGDMRLLRVVMENLVGNAWKFTSHRAHAEIAVGQIHEPDGVPVFFVRDNGAGFDMAYADKLFTAFQRLHGAQEFPGSGIGLATVSRVVSRHGGRLWADAKPDEGACFYFTVPGSAASASTASQLLR
ncbi:MAG: PAS domain S-box protein [Polaromonas sp.]